MSPSEVNNLPCLEIIDNDGRYLATLIVPPEIGGMTFYDSIKIHAEYLGLRGNTVLSPEKRDLKEVVKPVEKYPNLVKAREARKARKEGVKV